MKIAIFTIILGKYDIFFEELYNSVNTFFLPKHEKTFYVFSDKKLLDADNIIRIDQKKLGWPYDTMMRFKFMNQIEEILKKNDYVFFFNANMKVLKEINEEILPTESNDFLVGCNHPLHYNWDINRLPFERNPKSTCHIPFGIGKYYFQGCFNGGRTKEFLEMSKLLDKNIEQDLKNNIIPIWHDESMLNWYYSKKKPLILPYTYIYPENMLLPGQPIMIQRDKWSIMNKHDLRN